MTFKLHKLQYDFDALQPYMSEKTVEIHYNKHTKKYFDTTNELIKGTIFDKSKTLDQLLKNHQLDTESTLAHNA